MDKKSLENRDATICLMIPVAILAKLIQHILLPSHFFYDSNRMLQTMLNAEYNQAWGGSYTFVAELFGRINIFNIQTLLGWSIELGIIFNIIVIVIYARKWDGMDLWKCIFAFLCVATMNIYAFNISKEIVQFVFFMIIVCIIMIEIIPITMRMVLCALVFVWESTFFRSYYIIMAALTVGIYFLFTLVRQTLKEITITKIIVLSAAVYFIIFAFFFASSIIMPESYREMVNVKVQSTGIEANTTIYDLVEHNGQLELFFVNYVINSFRMMFPIELIKGGIYYAPFIIFQILEIVLIFINIKRIRELDEKQVIAISAWLAFFFGSVIFEPDFGSFVRHETATFPVLQLIVFRNPSSLQKGRDVSNVI